VKITKKNKNDDNLLEIAPIIVGAYAGLSYLAGIIAWEAAYSVFNPIGDGTRTAAIKERARGSMLGAYSEFRDWYRKNYPNGPRQLKKQGLKLSPAIKWVPSTSWIDKLRKIPGTYELKGSEDEKFSWVFRTEWIAYQKNSKTKIGDNHVMGDYYRQVSDHDFTPGGDDEKRVLAQTARAMSRSAEKARKFEARLQKENPEAWRALQLSKSKIKKQMQAAGTKEAAIMITNKLNLTKPHKKISKAISAAAKEAQSISAQKASLASKSVKPEEPTGAPQGDAERLASLFESYYQENSEIVKKIDDRKMTP